MEGLLLERAIQVSHEIIRDCLGQNIARKGLARLT